MPHRVFVTGATGYLGSAIAARFASAGHEVRGLTRHGESARSLETAKVKPVLGDLSEPGTYLADLKNCDTVVHAAVDMRDAASLDQQALTAIRQAAEDGRVRRLLYTSGMWVYGDSGGRVIDETTEQDGLTISSWRTAHEQVAIELGQVEVQTVVLQPALVYGESRGILAGMFAEAREKRTVTYPGDGSQHWGMVHRDDLAEAYLLALDKARAGERYILCDESHFTLKQIAEAIARATGATARAWPREDVLAKLGPYGEALLASQKCTAAKARRELGWAPKHLSFVEEAEALAREWEEGQGAAVR
jgi:nucleoside-diphosphate-sugar epimerase